MDNENNDPRYEPELGIHEESSGLDDEHVSDRYEFEIETETVFKRLADDIYKSKQAGIREPLTNAVTAIIRSVREGHLESVDEGIILFEIDESDGSQKLRIRDNGIGITRSEISEVVSVIGSSTSRSDQSIAGQFGMGFLAIWMLVGGPEGGFTMHSNPRGVDEPPISGIWTSNDFSEFDDSLGMEPRLTGNDYGTEFEILLDNNISIDDINRWISIYAEWARVPVMFRHVSDGNIVDDDEFPVKQITDKYDKLADGMNPDEVTFIPEDEETGNRQIQHYTVENEFFTATTTNVSLQHSPLVILLDVPISLPRRNNLDAPLSSFQMRMKVENSVVVEGPNKGKFVVSNTEAEENDQYISQDNIRNEDVVMPGPTGTRDTLDKSPQFWNWLSEKLKLKYYRDIADILYEVDTLSDYRSLSDEERKHFFNVTRSIIGYPSPHRATSPIQELNTKCDITFSNKFAQIFPKLYRDEKVSVAPEGASGISKQENREAKSLREIVANKANSVFMAHRISQETTEFVWASENDHMVIRIPSEEQEFYKEKLDWKHLNDLDPETDLEMADDVRKQFTDETTELTQKTVKPHVQKYGENVQMTVSELIDKVQHTDGQIENTIIDWCLVFNRSGENISDHKQSIGLNVAGVSASKDVHELLVNKDGFLDADTAIEDIERKASDGNTYILNNLPENIVPHIVPQDAIDYFRTKTAKENIQTWLEKRHSTPENPIYLPITKYEAQIGKIENSTRRWFIDTSINRDKYRVISFDSEVEFYASTVLDSDNPALNALSTVSASWEHGGKEILQIVLDNAKNK